MFWPRPCDYTRDTAWRGADCNKQGLDEQPQQALESHAKVVDQPDKTV